MRNGTVLRLTQTALGEDRYRVEIIIEEGGQKRRATSEFSFSLTRQDQEDIRWYLEDYPETSRDPGKEIAERVEARMKETGEKLFTEVFENNRDAQRLWNSVIDRLNETRVEIVTGVQEATAIPWELMRDPTADAPLLTRVRSFVRASEESAETPEIPRSDSGTIRILLAICRPKGRTDVPFRSVASRLIRGLSGANREVYQLDVLRPPTFEELGRRLRDAKDRGEPYHVVHFDGHGAFLDMEDLFERFKSDSKAAVEALLADLLRLDSRRFSPEVIYPGQRRKGRHGYLVFDNPKSEYKIRLVDGPELGRLLRDADVSVLVLNACRSAHAEAPERPETATQEESPGDVHAEVRVYGSLAQEVMDAGMAGTVAMRYNVYVDTAARFVADLYSALARGQSLGQAVTLGRKQLSDNPVRETVYGPTSLQDWCVPVVYEAAPVALFPEPKAGEGLDIQLDLEEGEARREGMDPSLPGRPDVGFFGRDETLLALDRAFDTQSIVLLHALAGSGKTTAAAEFARWYLTTSGVPIVLFSSFEHYKPLDQVLGDFGQMFDPILQMSGVQWSAITEVEERLNVAMQVLGQIPVLWIWDNVEPVTGFPAGTESAWREEEQEELADFLREARETKARFLLTSRRGEKPWLGDLPARIGVPPMPMHERLQLTRALAERHGRKLADVDDWRPLLRYADGNPLTITVVVGQALRDGLTKHSQIEEFVDKLRAGEAELEDDPKQGRSRSLRASLQYGFEHAFTEGEHRILALLHLFQGFVNVGVLVLMGDPESEWCLNEIRDLTREMGISLLDRAAEVGLLTAHGGGYYSIHPALPWFFRELFQKHYSDSSDEDAEPPARRAERALVEAMAELGNYYIEQYARGNRDVIAALTFEENNLLHARRVARENGWRGAVTAAMQGLRSLYAHTGRWAEWKRLVEEIVPDFVDPETDGPLPGQEEGWSVVIEYRVCLAGEEYDWEEAERLQKICVEWDRKRATLVPNVPVDSLSGAQRNDIRTLAVSLNNLARTQTHLGRAKCRDSYEEALQLAEHIGEKSLAAICALNFGNAYMRVPGLRDLDRAEFWCWRSLKLRDERDQLGQAICFGQLGGIALERFEEASTEDRTKKDLLQHLEHGRQRYLKALQMTPESALNELAVAYNQLGIIYNYYGQIDTALHHYNNSIRYTEFMGDLYRAAKTRINIAFDLTNAGRLQAARAYAQAAMRNFESYGDRAAEEIQKTKELIAQIEAQLV